MKIFFIFLILAGWTWTVWNYYIAIGYIQDLVKQDIPYVYDASKLDDYCWGEGWKK